jgi:hypothetical protein
MLFIILLRVTLSVSANAIQKRLLLDGARVNQAWILTYALMLGPATIAAAIRSEGGGAAFWRDILIGGGLDAIGNLAMVAALRGTDLSAPWCCSGASAKAPSPSRRKSFGKCSFFAPPGFRWAPSARCFSSEPRTSPRRR